MGHILFAILHLLAILFGFVGLVVTVPLHIIYAMIAAPKGTREDGKPRTGGWFGPLIDDLTVRSKMKDCPYCKKKVDKTATKCPYCQEWIQEETGEQLQEAELVDEEAENQRLIDESMHGIKAKFPDLEHVEPTPYHFFALVKHNDGFDIIRIGGFDIEKIPAKKLDKFPELKTWATERELALRGSEEGV